MELNIEKFNPTKKELTTLSEKYKNLEITGIDDKKGYEAVHKARVELKGLRVKIQKTGKEMRSEALTFQKAVIEREKEYIGIIEPIERDLQDKQEAIDKAKEREKRKILLPDRRVKVDSLGLEILDDELLAMDEKEFATYYNDQKEIFLAEKERKLQEEKESIERKKRERDIAEQRAKELEEAKKAAEEKAKLYYEQKLQEEKTRIEREEREREERRIRDEEARKQAKKEEEAKIERTKKYKEFLRECGYTNDQEFKVEKSGNKIICYKKVGEIVL